MCLTLNDLLLESRTELSYCFMIQNRFTARLLSAWLIVLPLGMWDMFKDSWNHVAMIPVAAGLSFFLFGIEELAVFLEEPFSVLPLAKMTEGIGLSAREYDQWHEDNEYKVLDRSVTYGAEAAALREMRRAKFLEEKERKVRNESDHVHREMHVFTDAAAYAESLKHTHNHKHRHDHVHEHTSDQVHTRSKTMTKTHTNTEVEVKPHYHSHTQTITRTETKDLKRE